MLALKIIFCAIFGFIGFYGFLQMNNLKELTMKATSEEKRSLEIIEFVALGLPLFIVGLIMAL